MQQYLLQDFSEHTVSSFIKELLQKLTNNKTNREFYNQTKKCYRFGHNCEKNLSQTIHRYSQIQPHFEVDCPGGWHKQILLSVEHLFNIKHGITKLFNVSYRQILVINRIDRFQ